MLRKPVDRIGLGGYLHLVEPFPDFCDYIEKLTDEFRMIKALHEQGEPDVIPGKVAILTAWGSLRSWTCSGHFHENLKRDLMHVLEALAGLPVEVTFLSFDDIKEKGISQDIKVLINAGEKNSAWSGGFYWQDEKVIEVINEWVNNGGSFIGIHEPSALDGALYQLRLSSVLGIDIDDGSRSCQGKYPYQVNTNHFINKEIEVIDLPKQEGVYLIDPTTIVLAEKEGTPLMTVHPFGKGKGIYLSGYRFNSLNTCLLLRTICYAGDCEEALVYYYPSNIEMECAYYEASKKLIVVNNSEAAQVTRIVTKEKGEIKVSLEPYEIEVVQL